MRRGGSSQQAPRWVSLNRRDVTLPGHLLAHARERGNQVAVHLVSEDAPISLTWGELARRAAAYADMFTAAGVAPGAVVVISLQHGPSLYPAFLGAMLGGAVPSFVAFPSEKQNPGLYWESHRALFERVGAAAVLTYRDNAAHLAQILPASTRLLVDEPDTAGPVESAAQLPAQWPAESPAELPAESPAESPADLADRFQLPHPDTVALLQHSSGTTGHKKGVMLTHRQITGHIATYAASLGITGEDRIASWLPLYHDMGLVTAFLAPLCLGSTVVALDAFAWADDPHSLLRAVDEYDCQFVWLPNFAFNHLVRTKQGTETYRLDRVRAFVNCSEPCRNDTFLSFAEAFGPQGVRPDQLQVSYAMAETVFAVTQTPVGRPPRTATIDGVTHVSVGPPLEGIDLRVEPAASTAVGELQVRGPWVSSGYYRNPDATAEAFDGEWYRTGDLGCVLDGEAYVLGRRKDVIIHHGVNYYSHDIEAAAATVPGIKAGRCAAVAIFDPAIGSERIELIAERDSAIEQEDQRLTAALTRAVSDRFNLSIGKVHLVEPGWLVKTTSGKVSRTENLSKLLAGTTPRPRVDPSPALDVASTVLQTVATTFDVPASDLGIETTADDVQGWDSLGHTVLMMRLGRALGRPVPESVAARARNIGELVDLLTEHTSPS